MFGDATGPVVQVDTDDIKMAWELFLPHLGSPNAAISNDDLARSCKPGADVGAVAYRTMMLTVLVRHAKQELSSWMNNNEHLGNAIFYACANVDMEWIPRGVTLDHLPLNFTEFLQLCNEYKSTSPEP